MRQKNRNEQSIQPQEVIEHKVPLAGFLSFYPTCEMEMDGVEGSCGG